MKKSRLLLLGTMMAFSGLVGCTSEEVVEVPTLEEGTWTGTIMPMDHPDERTEIIYRVSTTLGGVNMTIGTSFDNVRPSRDVEVTVDSLYFVFDEPESEVELTCALGLQSNGNYEGKCLDPENKWAWFTMRRPDKGYGNEA